MSGFTLFLRALAAPALRAPFVLGFALPVLLIPSVLRLSFDLFPDDRVDVKDLWFTASFLLDPLVWSVVAIAWCRTLMRPLDYPRPLIAIRAEPLFHFLGAALCLVLTGVGLLHLAGTFLPMGLTSYTLPGWHMFFLLGLAVQTLSTAVFLWPVLIFGRILPGIALRHRSALRALLRDGARRVVPMAVIALGLAILHTLAHLGLGRFLILFVDHPLKDALTTVVPQFMSPTLFALNMLGKAVINALTVLVLLAALCGEYVRFRGEAQQAVEQPA